MARKYRVRMYWYSQVEVTAKNKEEAKELGTFHEDSEPHLDKVDVEIIK